MSVALRANRGIAEAGDDVDAGSRAAAGREAHPHGWENRYGRRLLYSDAIVVIVAVFGAQVTWVHVHSALAHQPLPPASAQPDAGWYSTAIIIAWLGFLAFFRSRDSRNIGTGWSEYRRVGQASLATFGGLAVVVYLFNLQLARGYFFIALPIGLIGLVVVRRWWRGWLRARRLAGDYSSRVVLVGSAASVTAVGRQLNDLPDAGFSVAGACVPEGQENAAEMGDDIPIIGAFDDVPEAVAASGADTVVITSADELPPQRIRELSWQLEPGQQHLIVAPGLTDIGGPRIHTRPVAGLPLIHVETPRYAGGKTHGKQVFDTLGAIGLLVLLGPVMLVIALAIKLGSPGPVLFRQPRIGRSGSPFEMLKFRSMVENADDLLDDLREDADAGNGVLFKMKDDPRVTPIGRVLRRYSLDELPQLINVLFGEMSLIGPRPPLASEVQEYDHHVHRRFLVKPGITGLWQVSGRSDLSWDESVRLDLYYVENWTMTGDLIILFRTARAVLARTGAY